MAESYFEDLNVGDETTSVPVHLTREAALAFARDYDPQPFHLDDEAAKNSLFGRLAASGWQTAALAMRAIVTSGFTAAAGTVGLGLEKLRWVKPVYPGDTLRVRTRIADKRDDPSKPAGVVVMDNETTNQDGEVVMRHTALILVPKRTRT
jgi:acyl dehydratase